MAPKQEETQADLGVTAAVQAEQDSIGTQGCFPWVDVQALLARHPSFRVRAGLEAGTCIPTIPLQQGSVVPALASQHLSCREEGVG